MNILDEFIDYLNEQVDNHSIYVWGGQGEKTITENWIRNMENSTTNANRAVAFWKKQVKAGYGNVLRAFDCSGLGIYWLCDLKKLLPYDMNADTLMTDRCGKISRSDLRRGDWVFRVNSAGRAYHIGYVVDDSLRVVEAMGRDVGVVKRSLNASGASYWNRCGRPTIFKECIVTEPVIDSKGTIELPSTVRKGNAGGTVKRLQTLLMAAGYTLPKYGADGDFGSETLSAVKKYQAHHALEVDGIVGKNTWTALLKGVN